MIRRLNPLYALLPLTILLGACTTDSDESVEPIVETSFKARYQPDAALMPFPTDAYRSGSTDGTLNIPEFESDPLLGQVQQMNLLDGYGLNSAIWADFSEPVDESTLALGQTVFVFDVTTGVPAPVTTFDVGTADFQGGRSVVELNPTAPLEPLHTYAVLLTNGIQSAAGDAASADVGFQAMLDAYPSETADSGSDTVDALYAQMVKGLLDLATGAGIGADNVVAAWTFTTQSTNASLAGIATAATAQINAIVPLFRDPADPLAGVRTTQDMNPALAGLADVYAGVIEMPYYLDPANLLSGYWEADADAALCQGAIAGGLVEEASVSTTAYCAAPVLQETVRVPVLLTVPNANASGVNPGCTAGSPQGVVIFQHGITQDRTNALAVADSLAQACHAVIAIDLPLHGITDPTNGLYASDDNPLYAATTLTGVTEQTFGLDLVNNETGAEGPDGVIDPSGEYFINLESPITARDALRQGAANLLHLLATIPAIDYNAALDGGASGADFGGLPVRFVGHSLGGITGGLLLGVTDETDIDAAVLAAPGGDVAELILDSESIYPEVEAGLAENGLTPGMRFFDAFFRNAQTLIESGDPINYAAAAGANHNVYMSEIVGGAGNLPDQVVPNSATEKLANAMGLPPITMTTVNPTGVDGLVQFNAGDHGSLLSPAASPAATMEMQTQMAIFIGGNPLIPAAAGGNAIVITDSSVVAQ